MLAGPGSGKTELLAVRIARILQTQDIGPHNILAVSFTEAAAKNLKLRLIGMIGDAGAKVAVHTFHSLGREIISQYPEHFFEGAEFRPTDELGQIEIIESILKTLSFGHPFGSYHPELGFTYRKDLLQRISQLKRAGLTPVEFSASLAASHAFLGQVDQRVAEVFERRLSPASIPEVGQLVEEIARYDDEVPIATQLQSTRQELLFSLGTALAQAEASGKATPLSTWKQSHTVKGDDGARHLKEYANAPKLKALAEIYRAYQEQLYHGGLYDFDDMLLTAVTGIEAVPSLKETLQERYQFILVDEFQDTNDAQMRLLYALTDAEVNEGRPNVLAVGDDDQAIYRFQGAEVTNLLKFLSWYREPNVITLTQNYRSGQPILEAASGLISRSSTRIGTLLPGIEKELTGSGPHPKNATVRNSVLPSRPQELAYVAQQIKYENESGVEYQDIAVISRTHRGLVDLLPHLAEALVPVRYNREQDILRLPMIQELIRLAQFTVTLARANTEEADYLLPNILAAPCWDISQQEIWRLSVDAGRKPWIPVMKEHQNLHIRQLADFLVELAVRSLNEPLPEILQLMVGAPLHLSPEDEDGELPEGTNQPTYRSPFHTHYFGTECLERQPDEYVRFLAALQTLVSSLANYRRNQELHLSDLLTFVAIHERNGISLIDTTPYLTNRSAVQLMTAHGAKGLEFHSVYILDAEQGNWQGSNKANKVPLIATIEPSSTAEQEDDYLRLLFVALTRAKRNLTIIRSEYGNDNKQSVPIAALDHIQTQDADAPELTRSLENGLFTAPADRSSRALLQEILDEYVLTATDLNAFLDVTRGGPALFLTERLLRFPQPRSAAASFGSAIHTALHRGHVQLKRTGTLPTVQEMITTFQTLITTDRLSTQDDRLLKERGVFELTAAYPVLSQLWATSDLTEFTVNGQGATIDIVPVTGKLDLLRSTSQGWVIADYKTGHPATGWDTGSAAVRQKMYAYRRQLLFYTRMVESIPEILKHRSILGTQLLFTEPTDQGGISTLDLTPDTAECERIGELVQAVHACIQAQHFPDIGRYSQSLEGIKEFEEDLIAGKYN